MNKVIILEGPDGGGKTTLANWMAERHGAIVLHEGPPPPGAYKLHYYAAKLIKALKAKSPIVFDRFHLGELVYGPIARTTDELGYYGMHMMRRLMASKGVRCYIVMPGYDNCFGSWEEKLRIGNDYLMNKNKFLDSYYKFMALTAYHERIAYDDPSQYNNQIAHFNEVLTGNFVPNTLPFGSIGNPYAEFLFVGEIANNKEDLDLPFFYHGNSSGYVNRAIWDAGFTEMDVAFTNAYDLDAQPRNLGKIKERMYKLKCTVAFGRKAEMQCKLAGMPNIVYIKHPAWWKRFGQPVAAMSFVLEEVRRVYAS
jgi:hypothetical protein